MNEKIKKPLTIAITAIVILIIIGLSVSLICVCTLNTNGSKVFGFQTFNIKSATVTSTSVNAEEKTVDLDEGQTAALINILNASDMSLTLGQSANNAAYSISLTLMNGKTADIKADGEYIYFDGKTYKTNGAVCNFLGFVVYGAL